MKTICARKSSGASLHAAGAVLWLALAGTVAAQAGGRSALDQVQAAEAAAVAQEQNPPSVPADWRHAPDLNEASRRFAAWQREMFQQRDEIAKKQARLLHQNMKVPPPLPPSEPAPEPALTRLDVPLPFWPNINLSLSLGEPTVSFGGGVQAQALSCVGASYKVQAAYAAKDNRWTVADPLEIKAAFGSEKVEAAGTYQLLGSVWTGSSGENAGGKKPVGGEISVELLQVDATVGYDTDYNLSLGAGYDLVKTPKSLSKLIEVSVGVEGRVEAPVVVHGLTRGTKQGLPTVLAEYSAKAAKYLTEPKPCPYCSAQGDLDCPTCHKARTVTCLKCSGNASYSCGKCSGRGQVSCPNCARTGKEACGSCSGKGRVRCSTCGGRGDVLAWRSEPRTRHRTVIDQIGFDSAGQPVYQSHTEPEEYMESVTYRETCGSCGGDGLGGTCGRCSGSGRVTCHKCSGSREVTCRTCRGSGSRPCETCRRTGKVTCATCGGKILECPLCKGKKAYGH